MTKRLQTHLDSIFSLSEKDFEFLCSAERIRAFGGQESYKEHLLFIQEIYPSLQMIEVLLRNKIDYFFKRAIMQASPFGNEWLLDLYAINFKPLKISSQAKKGIERLQDRIHSELVLMRNRLKFPYSTNSRKIWKAFLKTTKKRSKIHNLLISKLNFGFWISLFTLHFYIQREAKIQLNFAKNIFPTLYSTFSTPLGEQVFCNFFDPICHQDISNLLFSNQQNTLHKIIVFVSMVRVIRNRISHCEHLLKYKDDQSSIQFGYQDHMFYLKANKDNIVEYLDFLLRDLLLL